VESYEYDYAGKVSYDTTNINYVYSRQPEQEARHCLQFLGARQAQWPYHDYRNTDNDDFKDGIKDANDSPSCYLGPTSERVSRSGLIGLTSDGQVS